MAILIVAVFPSRLSRYTRSPEGILKVIKETRQEAMQAATDLLENGMAFVTIIAEGRVYTVEEFALTVLDRETDFDAARDVAAKGYCFFQVGNGW